jgi:hypothetical protein
MGAGFSTSGGWRRQWDFFWKESGICGLLFHGQQPEPALLNYITRLKFAAGGFTAGHRPCVVFCRESQAGYFLQENRCGRFRLCLRPPPPFGI